MVHVHLNTPAVTSVHNHMKQQSCRVVYRRVLKDVIHNLSVGMSPEPELAFIHQKSSCRKNRTGLTIYDQIFKAELPTSHIKTAEEAATEALLRNLSFHIYIYIAGDPKEAATDSA